jgi:monofunctional biosynthetic peptidoglycan transglycosylase
MARRLIKWILLSLAMVVALALCAQLYFFSMLVWWRSHDPQSTAFMDARFEALQEARPNAKLKHVWVPYAKISNNLKRAVLAAEDDKFVDHEGFDWEGIQKALQKNERRGKVVAGGSTISQPACQELVPFW